MTAIDYLKNKVRFIIAFVIRRAFGKYRKVELYRTVNITRNFSQQEKMVEWYEFFGMKFFEKITYRIVVPEHINCRCQIIEV